jgi:hypothetical protein
VSKKQYPSISSPEIKQDGPQYIVEILLSRQEAKKKKTLPHKFWSSTPEWKKRYRQTLFWVRAFLKTHSIEATLAALNSASGKYIYSTASDRLDGLVAIEQVKIDSSSNLDDVLADVETNDDATIMKPFGKQSMLNKLRELDG